MTDCSKGAVARAALPLVVALSAAFGAQAADDDLYLLPRPKNLRVVGEPAVVPSNIAILTAADQTPVERYALEQLQGDLDTWFGLSSTHLTRPDEVPSNGSTLIAFGRHDAPHVKALVRELGLGREADAGRPEGYRLTTRGARALVAGADDNGVLYGVFTLVQLLRRADGQLRLPQVEIVDYPGVRDRALTNMSCYYGRYAAQERSNSFLNTYARLRYNILPSRLHNMSFEFKNGVVDEQCLNVVSDFAKDCHKRGMKALFPVYFLGLCQKFKRALDPCRPEDVRLIQNAVRRYCEAGLDGFHVNFDDIRNEHIDAFRKGPSGKKGMTLGQMHAEWVRKVKEVADEFGPKKIITCPYAYVDRYEWKKGYNKYNGEQSLEEFCGALADPFFDGVDFFHCAFEPDELAALRDVGMRNYVWWFNYDGKYFWDIGRREYKPVFSQNRVFSGFKNPLFGWGIRGPFNEETQSWEIKADTLAKLRTLPERTHGLHGCMSHWRLPIGFGAFVWDPAGFDWPAIERAQAARTFGPDCVETYLDWKVKLRSLCRDYNTLSPYSADREARTAEYRERYGELKAAFDRLLDYHQAFRARPGFALLDAFHIDGLVKQMRKNDAVLADLFTSGRFVKAVVGKVQENRQAGRIDVPLMRTMRLEGHLTSYVLPWEALVKKGGDVYSTDRVTAGIGMSRPSEVNWFNSGFFNLEVNGISLGNALPEFDVIRIGPNEQGIRGAWKTHYADVEIVFSMTEDDALLMDGKITPKGTHPHTLKIELFCVPSCGNWNWPAESMDKWLMSARRDDRHPKVPYIDPSREHWLLYYDRINDYPHVNKGLPGMNPDAKGPCALLLEPENVHWCHVNLANRFIRTLIQYKKGARRFRLALYEMHRVKNEEAIRYFKENGEALFDSLRFTGAAGEAGR